MATHGGNDDHRPKKKQLKYGIGPKTGVELQYHAPVDYRELSDAKKAELKEWRENNKKVGATAAKQVDAATIAAAVAKEIRKFQAMEAKKKESKDEMDAHILSVVKGAANIPKKSDVAAAIAAHAEATAPETPKVPAKLKSILKGKKGASISATAANFEANPHLDLDLSNLSLDGEKPFPDTLPSPDDMLEKEASMKKRRPKVVIDPSQVAFVINDDDDAKDKGAKKPATKKKASKKLSKIVSQARV